MSKHTAPTTLKTLAVELAYHSAYGISTPDRNGKHRMVEAFNPMTGITTRFHSTQEACIPCEQIKIARKQAAA